MLHILLLILKIIGIVLLAIIGLILLIVCSVIFVPIRYQFDTKYYNKPVILAKVSWLLHMISVKVSYESDLHFAVKLFGLTIVDNKKTKKEKRKKKKSTKINPTEKQISSDDVHLTNKSEGKTEQPNVEINFENSQKDVSQSPKKLYDKIVDKIKGIYKKLVSLFENIQAKIDNIINKLSNINDKKDSILGILFADQNRSSFLKIKNTLFKMFGSLLPRKIRAELSFGFEDPSTTGYVLGVAGVLYPVYSNSIHLYPDFQNKVFEGWIKGRGRIQVYVFIRAALTLILDKKIRNIAMDFKKVFK